MKRLCLLPSNLSRIALTTIRNVEVVSSGNKKKILKGILKKKMDMSVNLKGMSLHRLGGQV